MGKMVVSRALHTYTFIYPTFCSDLDISTIKQKIDLFLNNFMNVFIHKLPNL